ncbi:Nucleic-acid-binding protein from transposon X-element [Araneus ventricosus]|uniref:Nucleic-acid-binding protein from transposon X-element n=1 Tax=Araneus ventricosus TaxID=182803 RepID=A0A4Y2EKT0_ARAVE|nr:Nucleic-acid-binding protein from transposon X-element [Araneus ventricosus]
MPPTQEGSTTPVDALSREELKQICSDLEQEIRDLLGFITTLDGRYKEHAIPMELLRYRKDVAKEIKRKRGEWRDSILCRPNLYENEQDVIQFLDKINDTLRSSGYETDSEVDSTADNNVSSYNNLNNKLLSVNESDNCNFDMNAKGDNSQMETETVNYDNDKANANENLNSSALSAASIKEMHINNGIGENISNGNTDKCIMYNVTVATDNMLPVNNVCSDNSLVYTVPVNDIHNARVNNNCVAYDIPGCEITPDAENHVMHIDPPPVRQNPNNETNSKSKDSFQYPNRKRGRALSNELISNKKLNADGGLPINNTFAILANLPTDDATSVTSESANAIIKPKIPPIMMKRSQDYRNLLKELNEVEKIECKAKEAGEFIKLFCKTPNQVRSLTDYLNNKGKEYFVIPDRAEKPIKVVIKGLPVDMDMEVIKSELQSRNFRVDKVNQLKKYKSREPLRIFQVHLLPTPNISDIYKVDCIDYTIVTVESYNNRHNHQCFNCQRWNHGSAGCRLNPKCVVCAGAHPSKDCPNKGKTDIPTKCANCNGPHTASYKGCPRYPKNITKSKIQPGKSFAAATRNLAPSIDNPNFTRVNGPPPHTAQNVNKPMVPPAPAGGNAINHPTPPVSSYATAVGNTNPAPPGSGGFQEIMMLVAEISKIFSGKNIPDLIRSLQATTDPYSKVMILAEAIKPNCTIP